MTQKGNTSIRKIDLSSDEKNKNVEADGLGLGRAPRTGRERHAPRGARGPGETALPAEEGGRRKRGVEEGRGEEGQRRRGAAGGREKEGWPPGARSRKAKSGTRREGLAGLATALFEGKAETAGKAEFFEMMRKQCFGVEHKRVNLVSLETHGNMSLLIAKLGVDTTEKGHSAT